MHTQLFRRKQHHRLFTALIVLTFFCIANAVFSPFAMAQGNATSEVGGNSRDFRSRQSGAWSDPSTWQLYRSGVWINADAAGNLTPSATNNVFIEAGHTVSATRATLGMNSFDGSQANAFVECNNLHISETNASITTTWAGFDMSSARSYPAHELRIYGKLRQYSGSAITRTDVSAPNSVKPTTIGAGSTLVFRGPTRIITQPHQWNATEAPVYADAAAAGQNGFFTAIFELGVMPSGDVTNLDDDPSGAIGTIQGNFVAGHIVVKRGTVRIESYALLANEGYTTSGTIQVLNNAIVQATAQTMFARTVLATDNVPNQPFAPLSRLRVFAVEDGGALDFAGNVGTVAAADVRFNGTVIYSRAADQTLLQRSSLLPSGENGDAADPHRLSSAVENYSSLTLRGSGLKTLPGNVTVSRVVLMQGTAKAVGQQLRFLRSTNFVHPIPLSSPTPVWLVNGGNTARIVNLSFRTTTLPQGIALSRSTNREQIDLTPPQTPVVDAAVVGGNATALILPALNTPFDTPINTSATTTLQYDSEQSDIMDVIEFPSGVQGPHNLVMNVASPVAQSIKTTTIQGPEHTTSLNGFLPRVMNGGAAASAYVDTRPNLRDARQVTAEGLIPASAAAGGLRPVLNLPLALSDGRVRRFEDGGRRGDLNNFGVVELRSGNLMLRSTGSVLTLTTTAIISAELASATNPVAGSEDATKQRGPTGPQHLAGTLIGGSQTSLVFNGGTALYPVFDSFNSGFVELDARMGIWGATGYAPSIQPNGTGGTGRYNLGPEYASVVDADGTVRRANNAYNVDLPYIRGGVGNLTMIRATSNVLTLLGNRPNTGDGKTHLQPESAGLQVYGTIATARGSIDLNGRNIELGGIYSNLHEAMWKTQTTDPGTGRSIATPFGARASTVRNTNNIPAYIGLTSPRFIVSISAPSIDFANENVASLGAQVLQNGNLLQMRVRRWQTGKTTLVAGQGLQTSGRYFEIETSGTLQRPVSQSSIRLEYTEDDLYGIPEDSLVVLRSGNLAGPWTVLSNVRTPIRPDPAGFHNQLTIEGTGLTFNFAAGTARYWAIAAPAQMTSVKVPQNLSMEDVHIAACFPNPARDAVQVRYIVRENAPVAITLHDLTGRVIAHLLDAQHLTGEYTLQIQTSMLTSGAYILRIQTPHSSARELVRVVR